MGSWTNCGMSASTGQGVCWGAKLAGGPGADAGPPSRAAQGRWCLTSVGPVSARLQHAALGTASQASPACLCSRDEGTSPSVRLVSGKPVLSSMSPNMAWGLCTSCLWERSRHRCVCAGVGHDWVSYGRVGCRCSGVSYREELHEQWEAAGSHAGHAGTQVEPHQGTRVVLQGCRSEAPTAPRAACPSYAPPRCRALRAEQQPCAGSAGIVHAPCSVRSPGLEIPPGCLYAAGPSPGVTALSGDLLCPSSASPAPLFSPSLPAGMGCASRARCLLRTLSLKRDAGLQVVSALDWGWGGRELST